MANPGDLSPANKDFYDEILETEGAEAAERFLNQQLMFDALPATEVIEGTGDQRGFPGRTGGDVVPGVILPAEETKEEFQQRTEAKQNEAQRELLYQSRGFALDEETEKARKASVERYKAEGFPDEDRLKLQYSVEFEAGVPDFNLSGKPLTGLDNLAFSDTEGRDILLQLAAYQDKRLQEDLQGRQTAQMKAIDDIYGFTGPRSSTALKGFGQTKTPVRAGRVQMNPEITKDMGTFETVVESLRPQVIVSGTDVRASRAQEEMDIRDLKVGLDTFIKQEENEGQEEKFWEDIYDTNVQMVANQLAPLPTDMAGMLDRNVRQDYEDKYDEAVFIAEKFAATKIRTAIEEIYKDNPDMKARVESQLELPGQPFDLKEFGTSALSFLATNQGAPKEIREYLYKAGVLEDPDAITESVAMTLMRDINFPLRLVINPAMQQAENIGLIKRRKPDEEIETALPAKTIEFTQGAGESPLDILGAGIKEAAVETATMRSLGNDLAQVTAIGIPVLSPGAQYMKGEEGYGFYNIDEGMQTTAPVMSMETSGADVMVGLGTAAELFIPIIPAARFLSTAGTAATPAIRAGAKALGKTGTARRLITRAGIQPTTFERLLTEGAATSLDVLATGGVPLAVLETARRTVPDIAGPLLKNQVLKRSAAKLGVAQEFGKTIGKTPSVYDEILVGESTVDDVASAVTELEIRARMSPEAADEIFRTLDPSEIGFNPRFSELSQADAKKVLDEGLQSESAIVRDTVELSSKQQPIFAKRNRTFIADDVDDGVVTRGATEEVNYYRMLDDYRDTFRTDAQRVLDDAASPDGPIGDFVDDVPGREISVTKESEEAIIEVMRARYYQLKQPGREYLIKAGIGDYVQLTPRTIVSKKWMDENFPDVQARMTENGENRFIDYDNTDYAQSDLGLSSNQIILDFRKIEDAIQEIQGFKVNTSDPYFFEILQKAKNKQAISFDDFRYFNDRMVEEFARDGITRVARDTELMDIAKLDPDTAPPIMDQLKGIRRGDMATAYRTTRDILRPVAKSIKQGADNLIARLTDGSVGVDKAKQNRIMKELEAETVDTRNFTTEVDAGFARLDRTTKTTFSQVAKSFSQSEFDELFPALKGMSKEEQVFVTIMSNQFTGKSFADLQLMGRAEMFDNVKSLGRVIDEETGTYADLVLREIMETYAGRLGSKAEVQEWLFANVRNNSRLNISDANQLYEKMARVFPELNNIKIDKLDALVNMIISKETKSIITRAAKKNFGNKSGITTTWSNNPVNGMARIGDPKMTPVFSNPARYQKFVQDTFDVKINTPDGSAARGEGMLELVRKYNLAVPDVRPRRPIQTAPKQPRQPKEVLPPSDPGDAVGMEEFAKYSERMDAFDKRVERFNTSYDQYVTRLNGYDDAQVIVESFDQGASQSMMDYIIGVSGSRYDRLLTPNELTNSFRYKLTMMMDNDLKLLSPAEASVFQRAMNSLDTAEGSDIFKSNYMNLNKTESGRYARNLLDNMFNGARRQLTQGMLGGKVLPNIVYHAENLLSAPLIAYITNPKTTLSVAKQIPGSTGLTGKSTLPYYQLRARASMNPLDIFEGTRYTNREVFDMFNQYNLGVSSQTIKVGDQLVNDLLNLSRSSKTVGEMITSGKRLGINGLNYIANPNVTSPWMRWADEVDRAFRERIFTDALRKGQSPATAADQARRVMLDYGMMPNFMKQGFGKAMLFFSFTWATSVELMRAMTTQKGLLRASALGNWHRNMSRSAGTWAFNDNRAYESFWTSVSEDDGASTAYTYIRSPYISNMMMLAELAGFGMGVATGRSERSLETALQGLSRAAYIPGMDIFMAMDKDFKRSVPRQATIQLMQDAYLPQFLSGMTGIGGFDFEYAVDRYNIEVRPPAQNIRGQQSFGGYQYRFRDNAGYLTFLGDQLIMNTLGINRTYSDYYNEAIQSGLIDLPENYYYGYDKKGTPGFYSILRERPMRIPKQQEAEIRKVKDTIRRLQQKTQQMKK